MMEVAIGGAQYKEVISLVPPSANFPYWTLYFPKNEGVYEAEFRHESISQSIVIRSDERMESEVTQDDIRHSKMPSVLSDYRDITS